MENNLNSPSIATLTDILSALGSNLAEFFREETEEKVVFSKEDFFIKRTEKSSITWLVPNSQKNMMEPIIIELMEGGSSYMDTPHEGEEFGYVLSGNISLFVGNKEYKAKKNECFYYKANQPHFIKNISKTKAIVLWVCTPPNF